MAGRKHLALIAVVMVCFAMLFVVPSNASAQSVDGGATVGVYVEETIPPPTTATPVTAAAPTTTAAPRVTTTTVAPTTTTMVVKQPEVTETIPASGLSGPDDNVVREVVKEQSDKSVIGSVKNAAKVAKTFFEEVAKGTPIADVAAAVLPENVATVVVPAVRTASTFAFPIGLAIAVLAFLVLQQRIDSTDPKLTAAPLAHEDDVVKFS